MNHELKTWPIFFDPIRRGVKSFELRLKDRSFNVGDTLILKEYDPASKKYTGRITERLVTYILSDARDFGLKSDFVCMAIVPKGPQ